MKYSTPRDHNIIVEQFKIYVIKQLSFPVYQYISISREDVIVQLILRLQLHPSFKRFLLAPL